MDLIALEHTWIIYVRYFIVYSRHLYGRYKDLVDVRTSLIRFNTITFHHFASVAKIWLFCSSLGQNLKTSTYIWENIFAVCVSIFGLVLFALLIGNMQVRRFHHLSHSWLWLHFFYLCLKSEIFALYLSCNICTWFFNNYNCPWQSINL